MAGGGQGGIPAPAVSPMIPATAVGQQATPPASQLLPPSFRFRRAIWVAAASAESLGRLSMWQLRTQVRRPRGSPADRHGQIRRTPLPKRDRVPLIRQYRRRGVGEDVGAIAAYGADSVDDRRCRRRAAIK